ncbi:MAG: methylated-DNA--[protein]-cysteine S-methyltransferase [Chloroflexota bacterium]
MSILPNNYQQSCDDYQRIEKAIYFLEANYRHQPELKEIAENIGLSEYHFQRIFTRWAGVSPKRFLQFLTKENAKDLLRKSSVLNTTYDVGLSSPGRLHDLFIHTEAVTPGEFKSKGAGVVIRYGFHPTPFGQALVGLTDRGICHLSFVQNDQETSLSELKNIWESANFVEDPSATSVLIAPIFSISNDTLPISLFLNGTNFQIKVWEALLSIPFGALVSYEQIALKIGQAGAQRTVATAIGNNPIAYLIPCHRVIRKMGDFGNYHWGTARKKAILGWETTFSFPKDLSQSTLNI